MTGSSSNDLHRLVYYSRNLIGSNDVRQQLAQILETSRRNNEKAGLTGALIFNSGVFAQVIEGQRRDIEQTFERIQQDERHGDVLVLAFERVAERHFPHWSMGHVGGSKSYIAEFAELESGNKLDRKRISGDRILEIMMQIAAEDAE